MCTLQKTSYLFIFVLILIIENCQLEAKPKAKPSDDKYTSKYDDTDVDAILNSKRLLNSYVNCLLDKGPCNPDGAELKKNLPEALTNDCEKCSKIQQKRAYQVLIFLLEKEQNILKELKTKYDPNGDFEKRLCKKINDGEIETHHRCSE